MMHRSSPVLVAAVAAGALAFCAAPAGATEAPVAPPPAPLLPGLTPPPLPTFPAQPVHALRMIRGARVVPRRVRPGRRARVVLALREPTRLRITLVRRAHGKRISVAVVNVPPRGRRVVVRLPRRVRGHRLHLGRYRVRIVAVDAAGTRSRPVIRRLVVRR
jgi:hypothetical protein